MIATRFHLIGAAVCAVLLLSLIGCRSALTSQPTPQSFDTPTEVASPASTTTASTPLESPQPSATTASLNGGQIAYSYGSWGDLQAALPGVPTQVTDIVYNPEHGPHTPASEQKNVVETVAAVSAAVHASGRTLDLVPDAVFTQAD